MHVKKNKLSPVKYQFNLSIFCAILGERMSTNMSHADGNLQIDPTFIENKNVPNFHFFFFLPCKDTHIT